MEDRDHDALQITAAMMLLGTSIVVSLVLVVVQSPGMWLGTLPVALAVGAALCSYRAKRAGPGAATWCRQIGEGLLILGFMALAGVVALRGVSLLPL